VLTLLTSGAVGVGEVNAELVGEFLQGGGLHVSGEPPSQFGKVEQILEVVSQSVELLDADDHPLDLSRVAEHDRLGAQAPFSKGLHRRRQWLADTGVLIKTQIGGMGLF